MTMDIEFFKELLCSLTQISPFNFEVWDDGGLVFSSRNDGTDISIYKQIEDFSTHVMSEGVFHHTSISGQKAAFGIPIRNDEQIIGSLLAYSKNSNKELIPNEIVSAKIPDVKEIKTLLTRLVLIIEDKWKGEQERDDITEELGRSFEDLHLYSNAAKQIKTLNFSNQIHNTLVLDILKTMRVDISFVKLFKENENKISFEDENMSIETNNIMEKFVEKLSNIVSHDDKIQKQKYFIVENSGTNRQFSELHVDNYRFLAVKIMHEDKIYGWIGLISFNLQETFRRSELRLLISMAEQLAMVIDNNDLYVELEKFVINLIKSMIYAVEAKDVYTRGHSERVSQFSSYMAEHLELNEDDKKNMKWAAILHDVGKIGVPESILCKEGPLDDDEYDVIKQHPRKGQEMLEHIEQLRDIIPGILNHHERYDGSGYPEGLKGEEIPFYARVIAIADTFDAITSNRSYRLRSNYEKAISIIEEVAGTQLDPYLVSVFKEVYVSKIALERTEQIYTAEMSI